MSKPNIITQSTPPNLIGKPVVEFQDDQFDALVYSKGYEVIHERSVACPCESKSNHSPLSSCQNCGGTGWVIFNPNKTKMVLQSMNMSTRYKEWSKENVGTVSVTTRNSEQLGFMDRITVVDSDIIFSQILHPQVYDGVLFAFTIYDIKSILEIFLFDGANEPLVKLDSSKYSFTLNKIILHSSYSDIDNLTISIRYKHYLQYHVIDLVKETRRSYVANVVTDGKQQSVELPFSAIARRSHYVLDALDYNGTNIIDNSYAQ